MRAHRVKRTLPAASVLGTLWYLLDAKHRRTAVDNIQLALQLPRREARRLARRNFIHLTRVFLEFLWMPRMSRATYRDFVDPKGTDHLLKSFRKGRGILLLTGHFGNWEWMAYSAPFFLPSRLNMVARPIRPEALDRWVTARREGSGNHVISKRNALLHTMKALKRNEMVGFLLDHNASKKTGLWTPFFGGYVLTHKTLAHLACKTGAPVHPVFNWRMEDGRYRIEIGPEIPVPETGDLQDRISELTARFNRIIETQIRRFPEQWYWIHRRFRRFRTTSPYSVHKKGAPS